MFELKDQVYKVEYEGLHMLCRSCGKFGHYAEGCPEKKAPSVTNMRPDEGQSVIPREAAIMNGPDNMVGDGDGPWVVVQKPWRPRKSKDGPNKDGATAGAGRNTGTGTQFEILETITEDPAIEGTMNDERNISDPPINDIPNSVHGKGRGKNVKHVADKKGKAVDKRTTRESSKANVVQENQSGTPIINNMQILQRTNNEDLTKRGNQGSYEISQRQDDTSNQYGIIRQVPHINYDRGEGNNNAHVGLHHTPRPLDQDHLGQAVNHNTIGPNTHDGETQDQRLCEEDMEIIPETPNLDQQEGVRRA
ncbi:hypothetical protein P8452_52926 [Trifolium repens]|nr:hypothetical protein P8452_52926 [Trifolium repens]